MIHLIFSSSTFFRWFNFLLFLPLFWVYIYLHFFLGLLVVESLCIKPSHSIEIICVNVAIIHPYIMFCLSQKKKCTEPSHNVITSECAPVVSTFELFLKYWKFYKSICRIFLLWNTCESFIPYFRAIQNTFWKLLKCFKIFQNLSKIKF